MIRLFAHPFSSYSWKAQIALDEKGIAYDYLNVDPEFPEHMAELKRLWPLGKFPTLVEDGTIVFESSAIIDYLEATRAEAGTRLIPADAHAAVEVRMMDRVFDNHVMTPMQRIVGNAIRPEDKRDPFGVEQAHMALGAIYAWLDARMDGREWATEHGFTLADCAAAPSLFYADWAHPLGDRHPALAAYRTRLLARPSVAKAVEGARPYRKLFPLGAPDRD